jgi:hypothetical protein
MVYFLQRLAKVLFTFAYQQVAAPADRSQGRNNRADNTEANQQDWSAQTETAQQFNSAFRHADILPSLVYPKSPVSERSSLPLHRPNEARPRDRLAKLSTTIKAPWQAVNPCLPGTPRSESENNSSGWLGRVRPAVSVEVLDAKIRVFVDVASILGA